MANGVSIHIGINKVDPKHYSGWDGALVACEFDANDMADLAKRQGFDTRTLLTKQATAAAVTGALTDAAQTLGTGDILFLTYSGHGGQVPDARGAKADELDDKLDETWVLYDRQLLDDELYALWQQFRPGVRIVVLSDSCHSGTATKVIQAVKPEVLAHDIDFDLEPTAPPPEHVFRGMPKDLVMPVYRDNHELYDGLQRGDGDEAEVAAGVLLLSGCQDSQTSADGRRNGLFTGTLLKVWDDGRFKGGYRRFWRRIVDQMPPWQSPNFFPVGQVKMDFRRQTPFTI